MQKYHALAAVTLAAAVWLAAGTESTTATPIPLTTTPIPNGPVVLGSGVMLMDQATWSGANNFPTGTITFTLLDPMNQTVLTSTSAFDSSDMALSPGFLPGSLGIYTWEAAYSGDSNNAPTQAAPEMVSVVAAVKTPEPASLALFGTALAGFSCFLWGRRSMRV